MTNADDIRVKDILVPSRNTIPKVQLCESNKGCKTTSGIIIFININ